MVSKLLKIFLLLFILSFEMFGQSSLAQKEAFLIRNRIILSESDSQQPVFNHAVNKYQVFLASEIHHKKGNYELRLELIRELHKAGKLDLLLLEGGYSYGLLVNAYLTTGNSELLDLVSYNAAHEGFYRELYKFSNSLPEEQKIRTIGVDVEGNAYMTIKWMERVIPGDPSPQELSGTVEKLKQVSHRGSYKQDEVEECLAFLFQNFTAYPEQSRLYLGEKYNDFGRVMNGFMVAQELRKHNRKDAEEGREQFLYETVLKVLREYPMKDIFGHFGEVHIPCSYQKEWSIRSDWNSLAARLNNDHDSPVRGRVCALLTYYPNWRLDLYSYIGLTKEESKLLKKHSKGERLALFDLGGEHSPFYHLMDKYQYIVVNRY